MVVLLALVLSGCGARLETPPPTEPTPDALEVARRAAASDVLAILEVAAQAEDQLDDDDPSAPIIAEILAGGTEHLEQLGGEYDSGLDPTDDSITQTTPSDQSSTAVAAPDGESAAPLEELVDRLAQAYLRTRGALESAPDPGLARLMASIATAQLTSAQALATSAELELPEITLPGTPNMPSEAPIGISSSDLAPLVLAEDGAGYAFEVLAAHLSEAQRVAALARASVHRTRGENAAEAAQIARTLQDPRRAAYDLPVDGTDETYVRDLELNLVDAYATLVGLAVEEERVHYFDLMIDSYNAAHSWGAKTSVFPGMPEQQE